MKTTDFVKPSTITRSLFVHGGIKFRINFHWFWTLSTPNAVPSDSHHKFNAWIFIPAILGLRVPPPPSIQNNQGDSHMSHFYFLSSQKSLLVPGSLTYYSRMDFLLLNLKACKSERDVRWDRNLQTIAKVAFFSLLYLDYWMAQRIHKIPDSMPLFPWRQNTILQRFMISLGHRGVRKVGGK